MLQPTSSARRIKLASISAKRPSAPGTHGTAARCSQARSKSIIVLHSQLIGLDAHACMALTAADSRIMCRSARRYRGAPIVATHLSLLQSNTPPAASQDDALPTFECVMLSRTLPTLYNAVDQHRAAGWPGQEDSARWQLLPGDLQCNSQERARCVSAPACQVLLHGSPWRWHELAVCLM